jgi:hypothetical protein
MTDPGVAERWHASCVIHPGNQWCLPGRWRYPEKRRNPPKKNRPTAMLRCLQCVAASPTQRPALRESRPALKCRRTRWKEAEKIARPLCSPSRWMETGALTGDRPRPDDVGGMEGTLGGISWQKPQVSNLHGYRGVGDQPTANAAQHRRCDIPARTSVARRGWGSLP